MFCALENVGADGGIRTHTPFRTKHFECSASAVPPHRLTPVYNYNTVGLTM